jgi:hypothetical protein
MPAAGPELIAAGPQQAARARGATIITTEIGASVLTLSG